MKKLFCFSLVAVLLFTLSFSCFAVSSAILSFAKDTVLSFCSSSLSDYSNSQQKLVEAARSFLFYEMVNFKSNDFDTFNTDGDKFTDECLTYFFDIFWSTEGGKRDIYNSDGDVFIRAAGYSDKPWSYSLCSFYNCAYARHVGGDVYYEPSKELFVNYYQSYLARYLIAQGETATDPNPGKSGLDIAPGYVSSDELADSINFDNTQYIPKTSNTWLMSYRNEKRHQTLISNDKAFFPSFVLSDDSSGNIAFSELFLLPFFKDKNGEVYYAKKQLHIYLRQWDDPNSDIYLGFDVFDFSSDFTSPVEIKSDNHIVDLTSSSLPVKFSVSPFPYYATNGVSFYRFETLTKFIDNSCLTTNILNSSSYNTAGYWDFYNSSQTDYKNMYKLFYNSSDDKTYYYNLFKNLWGSEYDDGLSDIGYIASKSLINFAYNDIDTSKIPSGQIVTVSGDTIYNYTITNPETGDSSKFGDYITNNYTYITNNYGEGGSGSGVGGNVTVGGEIEVGGSVGVDVNVNVPDININVNGGAGGSSSLPDTDLVENLPEAPSGFIDYTASLFSFLPAQILSLLIAGLAAAIFCRIWGR